MTPENLKQALEAAGWQTSEQILRSAGNTVDWYAWPPRSQRATPTNCACNDKPPSFVLEPFSFEMNAKFMSSVTFRLCGELPNGRWVDFKVYSVDMDEAMQEIEPAKAVLFAAWEAACAMSSKDEILANEKE